jgi:ATP adenylyltransferase
VLYYGPNARSPAQMEKMQRLEAAGVCLFCHREMRKPGGKGILLESRTWVLVENDFPYDGTSVHAMLIPKRHVASLTELSLWEWIGYRRMLRRVANYYDLTYFVNASRNGDPTYTGATIMHLHIHLIVGDPKNPGEPVKFY